MQRWLAIGVTIALLIGGGWIWSKGGGPRGDRALAAATGIAGQPVRTTAGDELVAPVSDVTPADREARRFNRYDKDRDGAVTREEYFVSRQKAYARLDLDGDGKLSFAEYSAKAAKKFMTADLNRDQQLGAAEFASTAVKRRVRTAPECPVVAGDGDDARDG